MNESPAPKTTDKDRSAHVANVSGGVNVDAEQVNVGGDVVGRDKISDTQNIYTGGGANIGSNVTVEGGSEFAGRDIFKVINNFFTGASEEVRDHRNRLILLDKVKRFWIEGVLEQSVYNAAMIELGKEVRPEAVERPWDMVLETSDKEPRTIPKGQKISEIFEQMEHALLILGEPGSGKTVTLLELVRETIPLAEKDPKHPVPVVFNLSSWAERRLPLQDWLVEELNAKYQIPRKIGKVWIEQDVLMLLLDGLDEVKADHRKECVEAINWFRKDRGLVYMAVCSRASDYEALAIKLSLRGAILVQSLSPEQIQRYLGATGSQLSALREEMQRDTELRILAQTPLMLSIMSLAYQDASADTIMPQQVKTSEERRQQLFNTYVQRMFERHGKSTDYSRLQSTGWLTWLASRMQRFGQSVFLLEQLQPTWLVSRSDQTRYLFFSRFIIGLGFGVAYTLIATARFGAAALMTALFIVMLVGSSTWLIDAIGFRSLQRKVALLTQAILLSLLLAGSSLLIGLGYLVFTVLPNREMWPTWPITPISLVGTLILWGLLDTVLPVWLLLVEARGGFRNATTDIQPMEALYWSSAKALKGIGLGIVIGAVVSYVFVPLAFGSSSSEIFAMALVVCVPLGAFFGGIRGKQIPTRIKPNQGIRLSIRNSLLVGLSAFGTVTLLLLFVSEGKLLTPFSIRYDFMLTTALWFPLCHNV